MHFVCTIIHSGTINSPIISNRSACCAVDRKRTVLSFFADVYLTCDIPGSTVSFTCWKSMLETATSLVIEFLYNPEY